MVLEIKIGTYSGLEGVMVVLGVENKMGGRVKISVRGRVCVRKGHCFRGWWQKFKGNA